MSAHKAFGRVTARFGTLLPAFAFTAAAVLCYAVVVWAPYCTSMGAHGLSAPRSLQLVNKKLVDSPSGWRFAAFYLGDQHRPELDKRWTSQVGQDKTVVEILGGQRRGYGFSELRRSFCNI